MKKIIIKILIALIAIYVLICGLGFLFQEKFLFFPETFEESFEFEFDEKFEELNIISKDSIKLNGLLFKADKSKGLVFYLHGNGKSLRVYGSVVKTYLDLNYDFFIWDFRGYGKSEGKIKSEKQLFEDVQIVYNEMLKRYNENDIIVFGYSIGTCLAVKHATKNQPKLLILQAPCYNFVDEFSRRTPFIPNFILKYRFENYKYITECKMPVVVFHGNQDKVFKYEVSLELKKLFKESDTLIILDGVGHNAMGKNEEYKQELKNILSKHEL